MAASPRFKVFNGAGDYIASFKELHHAAILIHAIESGSIRDGHLASATLATYKPGVSINALCDQAMTAMGLTGARS